MFSYTKKELASEIISLLKNKKDLSLEYIEYIESESKIISNNEYIYLDNIYLKVKNLNKEERIIWIKKFLQEKSKKPDYIFPVIRLKSLIDVTNLYQIVDENHHICHMPFSASKKYVVALVFNYDENFEYVTNSALKTLNLTKEKAFNIALKNLNDSIEHSMTKLIDGLYESYINEDFEPSRILIETYDKLKLKGKPVVFLLQKSKIYLCGSEDSLAFEAINLLYGKSKEEGFFLSEFPLIFDGKVWKDFIPENINIRNQIKIGLLDEYTSTKEFVDIYNANKKIDIFLAEYKLYNIKGSDIYQSHTTVAETITSWIPKSDYINFVSFENDNPKLMGSISWNIVMSNFKDFFTPIKGEPKRYEISQFPPKDILAQYIKK